MKSDLYSSGGFKNEGYTEVVGPIEGIGDDSRNKGTALRYNSGKPRLSHIPLETLYGEASVWENGAKKYGKDNWKKGMPWLQAYDSLMRHLVEWRSGVDIDNESGLSHLDHVACNLRMLLYYREHYKEGDDR